MLGRRNRGGSNGLDIDIEEMTRNVCSYGLFTSLEITNLENQGVKKGIRVINCEGGKRKELA
jgi:hypothetical protein